MHIWKTRLWVKTMDIFLSFLSDIAVVEMLDDESNEYSGAEKGWFLLRAIALLVKIFFHEDVSLSCLITLALINSVSLFLSTTFILAY